MCGVPVHSAESYLARLIKGGHRVAIAEQTESPAEARKARGSKALVERAIIRLVTPGTLTEETLLESASANWLAAIGRAGDEWAIAAADISTGRFELVSCGPGELAAELARLSPAETIADVLGAGHPDRCRQGRVRQPCRRARAQEPLRPRDARRPRRAVARRAGRGGRAARLSRRDAERRGHPARRAAPDRAGRATWRSTPPAATASSSRARSSGSVAGSLLGEIDRCQTAAGRRLLCEDIAAPLTDRRAIEQRLALVAWLHEDAIRRERVRVGAEGDARLRARARPAGRGARQPARSRAASRRPGRGRARSKRELDGEPDRPPLLDSLLPRLGGHDALVEQLSRALVASPPLDASKGGYIAEGYDADARCAARRRVERPPRDRRARGPDTATATGHQLAEDPPQRGARLSCRSVGAACRQADGARQRLHPSPDPRRASSASTRPNCTRKRAG